VIRALAGAALALCLAVPAARALEFTVRPQQRGAVIIAQGPIQTGDGAKLRALVAQTRGVDEVWFNSPGGAAVEGLVLGRAIRDLGLATRIPNGAMCASACSYAFLGGLIRSVDQGGRYGVHMFTAARDDAFIGEVARVVRESGPQGAAQVVMFIEQRSAKLAAERARFLVEQRVSLELMTPAFEQDADGMNWLNQQDLRRYNVVNTR
jgi:hypothetical protein